MKQVSLFSALWLSLLLAFSARVFGQSGAEAGYFRFTNVAPLKGNIFLSMDNLKLKPKGFACGEKTGFVGILPGPHQFSVSSADGGTATAAVASEAKGWVTLLAYCKPGIDPKTHKPTKLLQLVARKDPPTVAGYHFQLLYASSNPEANISVNGSPLRLKSFRDENDPELKGNQISVQQGDKVIVRFSAPEAGNFLVVLYDAAAGGLAGLVLPHYK